MDSFNLYTYPRSRRATFDVGAIGARKHHVAGLLEVDVTSARRRIREAIRSGRDLSFISWTLKVVAGAVVRNDYIHAINARSRTQVAFKDVDISLPVERLVDGARVPLVMVLRKANEKSIEELCGEIRAATTQGVGSARDYVLGERRGSALQGLFFRMPRPLRALVWRYLLAEPFRRKAAMGTVMVTTVGMAGRFPGWILPKSLHNLCVGIGSIVRKPWVHGEKVEIREILNLTVLFDHDVVDGSPAAKFTDRLVRDLEGAAGL